MRIHQNGPLEKFTFMHFSILCIIMYNAIKICGINLCDRRLTRIIHINRTHAEKCRFMVMVTQQHCVWQTS